MYYLMKNLILNIHAGPGEGHSHGPMGDVGT